MKKRKRKMITAEVLKTKRAEILKAECENQIKTADAVILKKLETIANADDLILRGYSYISYADFCEAASYAKDRLIDLGFAVRWEDSTRLRFSW